MMHYKKLLAVLVVFAMVFSFTPSLVRAEEKDITSVSTAEDLAAALEKGGEIKLLNSIEVSQTLTVPVGTIVILDLAGYAVSMNHSETVTANHEMILNKGSLTIQDTKGDGKLSYQYTGANVGTSYGLNTITSNPGSVLSVKSGTIENLTYDSGIIAYAIDGRTNGGAGDVAVNISGGTITSQRQAVRIFANSVSHTGTLNISGGTFNGRVIIQNANTSANKAALNITGGIFNVNAYKTDVLYVGGSNGAYINMTTAISGGTFNGEITSGISGSFITGGSYQFVYTDYIAEGYDAVKVDDYYIVHKHDSLTDIPAKDATCTEDGLTAGKKCSVCGTITVAQTVLPVKDHTEVDLPAKEATCTETGLTAGKKCSICGTITVAQTVVEKKSHSLTPIPATAATYFAPGNLAYYVCSTCDKLFADAEGAKEVTLEEVSLAQLVKIEDTTADVSTDVVEDIIKDAADAGTTDIVITVTQDKLADDNKEDTPADPNPDEGDTDAGEPAPEPETAPVVTKTQLPVAAVQQVANLHEEATLTINMTNATVTMDKTTLDVVTEKAKTEQTDVIALEIEHIEEEQLAPAQQTAVAEKTVAAVISASILVNDKEVHDFEGGKVTVAIPFQMDAGTVASDYVVLYIADDGSVEEIPSTIADGKLVMTLSHFSEYVVVNTTVAKDPTNPGTGEGFDIGMMLFLMVASAAAIVIVSNKKRFAQ